MVAVSVVQSSSQTFIHNAILFIDNFDNAWYSNAHWPIGMPYLSIIPSDVRFFWSDVDFAFFFRLVWIYLWGLQSE